MSTCYNIFYYLLRCNFFNIFCFINLIAQPKLIDKYFVEVHSKTDYNFMIMTENI